MRIYDYISNTGTGQGDDYTTGCLLNYPYFNPLKIKLGKLLLLSQSCSLVNLGYMKLKNCRNIDPRNIGWQRKLPMADSGVKK